MKQRKRRTGDPVMSERTNEFFQPFALGKRSTQAVGISREK